MKSNNSIDSNSSFNVTAPKLNKTGTILRNDINDLVLVESNPFFKVFHATYSAPGQEPQKVLMLKTEIFNLEEDDNIDEMMKCYKGTSMMKYYCSEAKNSDSLYLIYDYEDYSIFNLSNFSNYVLKNKSNERNSKIALILHIIDQIKEEDISLFHPHMLLFSKYRPVKLLEFNVNQMVDSVYYYVWNDLLFFTGNFDLVDMDTYIQKLAEERNIINLGSVAFSVIVYFFSDLEYEDIVVRMSQAHFDGDYNEIINLIKDEKIKKRFLKNPKLEEQNIIDQLIESKDKRWENTCKECYLLHLDNEECADEEKVLKSEAFYDMVEKLDKIESNMAKIEEKENKALFNVHLNDKLSTFVGAMNKVESRIDINDNKLDNLVSFYDELIREKIKNQFETLNSFFFKVEEELNEVQFLEEENEEYMRMVSRRIAYPERKTEFDPDLTVEIEKKIERYCGTLKSFDLEKLTSNIVSQMEEEIKMFEGFKHVLNSGNNIKYSIEALNHKNNEYLELIEEMIRSTLPKLLFETLSKVSNSFKLPEEFTQEKMETVGTLDSQNGRLYVSHDLKEVTEFQMDLMDHDELIEVPENCAYWVLRDKVFFCGGKVNQCDSECAVLLDYSAPDDDGLVGKGGIEKLAPMNVARSNHSVVLMNYFYFIAVGGEKNKTAEFYSTVTNEWTKISDLPSEISNPMLFVKDQNELYSFFGTVDSDFNSQDDRILRILPFVEGAEWEVVHQKAKISIVQGSIIQKNPEEVYIFGGINSLNILKKDLVMAYDFVNNELSEVDWHNNLGKYSHNQCGVEREGILYAVDNEGDLKRIDVENLSKMQEY